MAVIVLLLVMLLGGLANAETQHGKGTIIASLADLAIDPGSGFQATEGKEPQYFIRRHGDESDEGGKNDFADRVMKEQEQKVFKPTLRELDTCTASCNGTDACANATGPIGTCSCNADYACHTALGAIGDSSCNEYSACYMAMKAVGTDSCNGKEACIFAQDAIGDNSCNGNYACFFAQDRIGTNSCNGENACSDACLPRPLCNKLMLAVGNNSCNGNGACDCPNPKGHVIMYEIGDGECNRIGDDFTGNKTCCIGEVFNCECTETGNGLVVGDNTCTSINRGFSGGTLKCNNNTCQFDTSECIECSDMSCSMAAFVMEFVSRILRWLRQLF